MASIFRNATLTISATTAENSTQGCGISNMLTPSTQFTLPSRASSGRLQAYISIRQTDPDSNVRHLLENAPIHKRAWIFQEKILSRRILHATHGIFIYQCATHIETEDSLVHDVGRGIGGKNWEVLASHVPEHVVRPVVPRGDWKDIRSRWWSWADDYSRRNLTDSGDRYAAFAGVTALYRDITGDEPVLGMWKNDLVLHLGWMINLRYASENVKFPAGYKAEERRPSWTWMSFPHGTTQPRISSIEFEDVDREVTPYELSLTARYKANVLDLDVRWTGRPLVTTPSHATLRLRGLQHRLPRREYKAGGEFDLDPGIFDPKDNREYDVFALVAYEQEGYLKNILPMLITVYLILEAVDRKTNKYRRIGRFLTNVRFSPGMGARDYLFGTYEEITLV
jgi:hypothetical protein